MKLLCIVQARRDSMHRYHVTQRAIDPSTPSWKKMPICRNDGLILKNWVLTEIETDDLGEYQLCGTCREVLRSKKIML